MEDLLGRLLPGLRAHPAPHSLIVHFPIALLPLAWVAAILSLREPGNERRAWGLPYGRSAARAARLLLFLASAGSVAAVGSGLLAARRLSAGPGSLVGTHRSIMLATAALAMLLLAASLRSRILDSRSGRGFLAVGLLVANTALVIGADRGALVALRARGPAPLPDLQESGDAELGAGSGTLAGGSPERGMQLYDRLRCFACHDQARSEETPGVPPSLAAAGSRLQESWMRSYLLDPHPRRWADEDRRPTVRMPDYRLLAAEAADLAAYLSTLTDSASFPTAAVTDPPLTERDALRGGELLVMYACLGCHELGGAGTRLGPALDGAGDRLQPAYVFALLADPQAVVPGTAMKDFDLWESDTRELTAFITTLRRPLGERAASPGEPAAD